MNNQAGPARFLGITVLGDFILSEGVEPIIENLLRIGATAVACNPTVTAAATGETGSFQPPIDAGSSPRVFDRPLFGKKALWVRGGVSYRPNAEFYKDSSYPPRQPNDLTDVHGAVIGEFVKKAAAGRLKVYFQIGAAQPSGLRDEDRPRLPNGEIPAGRLADTASLASDAVRSYNRAYVRDLLEAYPQISGFRIDWPETPCYTLGEVFQDFSPHVQKWAGNHGFDFAEIQDQAGRFYEYLLSELTDDDLRDFTTADRGKFTATRLMMKFPAIMNWLRMKAALSADLVRDWRDAITDAGGKDKELCANAFMPPYSLVTGLDFTGLSPYCTSISPKLYTMHWSLMVKFWGDAILEKNPGLDERLLVRTLVHLMDLSDDGGGERIADYGYPHPDEPHPIPNEPQIRKIAQAQAATPEGTDLYPLVHGYGPADDFRRRLQLVADTSAAGVWINRYGYLSEEKLAAVAAVWK